MQEEYLIHLRSSILKLKKGLGELYIQDKPFVSIKESENAIYCRLSKDKQTDPITYEVVSHYFNRSISKKIEEKLLRFGLNLGVNENYSKEIILNSEIDINNTALEIANIFESVFNLSDSQEYYFHEGIVDNRPASKIVGSGKSKGNQSSNENRSLSKISPWRAFAILAIFGLVLYSLFYPDTNQYHPKELIFNNEFDASVAQVETYLKENLNDPDSYQSISWSAVVKINDTKEVGFPSYQVRHKYRAKNSFGGYVVEEKVFRMDYKGNVVDVKEFSP